MRLRRHAAILRIVRDRRIESQEELREALAAEDIAVTQGTLSRDIRDLGLVKLADAAGRAAYAPPAEDTVAPTIEKLLPLLLVDLDAVGPFLVLRTARGSAGALAAALDGVAWPEIIGTIAGVDTVLVITRGVREREAAAAKLEALIG